MGDKALPLSLTKVILENVTHIFRQMGFLLMILRSRQIDLHRVMAVKTSHYKHSLPIGKQSRIPIYRLGKKRH